MMVFLKTFLIASIKFNDAEYEKTQKLYLYESFYR